MHRTGIGFSTCLAKLMNDPRNHHFISQNEQRLNAANPSAAKHRQRIYEFELLDRGSYTLRLTSHHGRPIRRTLAFDDLFSFHVPDSVHPRENLEGLFQRYENTIRSRTEAILQKVGAGREDIEAELFDIFLAKMLNFVRNPFCVQKVLNTFPALRTMHPPERSAFDRYMRLLIGTLPQQEYLCDQLEISRENYREWLRLLYLLLTPLAPGQPVFFETMLRKLFESRDNSLHVMVHTYQSEFCLLSDRGFSHPIPEDDHLVFDFNLGAHAFVRYAFMNPRKLPGIEVPEFILESIKLGPKIPYIQHLPEHLAALQGFNRRVIDQCYQQVYCAGTTCYGANILPPLISEESGAAKARTGLSFRQ